MKTVKDVKDVTIYVEAFMSFLFPLLLNIVTGFLVGVGSFAVVVDNAEDSVTGIDDILVGVVVVTAGVVVVSFGN